MKGPTFGAFPVELLGNTAKLLLFVLAGLLAPVQGKTGDLGKLTVVLFNSKFAGSEALAHYYASKRGIPPDQVLGLTCSTEEAIERQEYDATIAGPLRAAFEKKGWWHLDSPIGDRPRVISNRIRFIALIRGMPLKIRFASMYPGDHPDPSKVYGMSNEAAVDSELAVLGLFTNQISGPLPNPYFRSFIPINDPGVDPRLMLVTRLDGPSNDDVYRMINDSINAEKSGLWGWTYLDARGTTDPRYLPGDQWLHSIADQSFWLGYPSIIENTEALFPHGYPMSEAILYFGWYSSQSDGALADSGFQFKPGAIAVHIYSFSGATIRQKDQSWVASLISHGVAATLGNVYEPYLEFTPHPDIFYDRLIHGSTFAESAYASLVGLSWMTTCIGDPLYRPFSESSSDQRLNSNPWILFKRLATKSGPKGNALLEACRKEGQTNPLFFEFAGLIAESEDHPDEAITLFEQAWHKDQRESDRFRALLDEIALLKRLNRQEQVGQAVKSGLKMFTGDAAQKILRETIP